MYNTCPVLDQRRRRWDNVVQMLYKCFAGIGIRMKRKEQTKYYFFKTNIFLVTRRWKVVEEFLLESKKEHIHIENQ